MTLTEQIKAIPLADIVEAEGTRLRKVGNRYEGLCPLHPDKNPSFTVFEDNHFKCWACFEYGDAADFIQRLHGVDFKQALSLLGITPGPMTSEVKCKIRAAKLQRELREKREQRIRNLIHTLGLLIRTTRQAAARLTPENFDEQCLILDPLCWWEHCHDMLIYGDEDEKSEALEALSDFNTISANPLFKPGFDYRRWLRGFNHATDAIA